MNNLSEVDFYPYEYIGTFEENFMCYPQEWEMVLGALNNPGLFEPVIFEESWNRPIKLSSEFQKAVDHTVTSWVRMTKHVQELKQKNILTFHQNGDDEISAAFPETMSLQNETNNFRWIGAFKKPKEMIKAVPPRIVGGYVLIGVNNYHTISTLSHDKEKQIYYQPGTPVVVSDSYNGELFEIANAEKCLELHPVSGIGSPRSFQGNEPDIFPALTWVEHSEINGKKENERKGLREWGRTVFQRREDPLRSLQETPVVTYLIEQLNKALGPYPVSVPV